VEEYSRERLKKIDADAERWLRAHEAAASPGSSGGRSRRTAPAHGSRRPSLRGARR
jgi:hypothetical protein